MITNASRKYVIPSSTMSASASPAVSAAPNRSNVPNPAPTPVNSAARITSATPDMIGNAISFRSLCNTPQLIFVSCHVRPNVANIRPQSPGCRR